MNQVYSPIGPRHILGSHIWRDGTFNDATPIQQVHDEHAGSSRWLSPLRRGSRTRYDSAPAASGRGPRVDELVGDAQHPRHRFICNKSAGLADHQRMINVGDQSGAREFGLAIDFLSVIAS